MDYQQMEQPYISFNPFEHKYAKIIATILAICCILVGIILIGISRNAEASAKSVLEGKKYAYGKITSVAYNTDSEVYDTQVVFMVDGTAYNFSVSNDTKYKQGSSVKVIYEEGNPSNCFLENKSSKGMYLASAILLIMGIILIPFAFKDIILPSYNQNQPDVRFNKMLDTWDNDTTNTTNHKQPYSDKSSYTSNSSAKVNIGTTAFYNKSDE